MDGQIVGISDKDQILFKTFQEYSSIYKNK